MGIPIYQVDAFTEAPFRGNPAAVCLLDDWPDEAWMQQVAAEMNLSETAFLRHRAAGSYDLRWFTPTAEVALCGHATLAAAHVLWETGRLAPTDVARFRTASGLLRAAHRLGWIELDFPAAFPHTDTPPEGLLKALGISVAIYAGRARLDWLIELPDATHVRDTAPDFEAVKRVTARGVIVTARSDREGSHFVSRFFAPGVGVDEDPVTGSSHCALAAYWAGKLERGELIGEQVSRRGGLVRCRLAGDRVFLSGRAVTVLRGELVGT